MHLRNLVLLLAGASFLIAFFLMLGGVLIISDLKSRKAPRFRWGNLLHFGTTKEKHKLKSRGTRLCFFGILFFILGFILAALRWSF